MEVLSSNNTEPFPAIEVNYNDPDPSATLDVDNVQSAPANRPGASSSLNGRLRRVSKSFGQSTPPGGFFATTGGIASSVFSGQIVPVTRIASVVSTTTWQTPPPTDPSRKLINSTPPVAEGAPHGEKNIASSTSQGASNVVDEPPTAAPFENGYHFPPRHPFAQSISLGSMAFWQFCLTPVGFCFIIYALNVVAWGGMLFLLLW